jgi:hypothetical protein
MIFFYSEKMLNLENISKKVTQFKLLRTLNMSINKIVS